MAPPLDVLVAALLAAPPVPAVLPAAVPAPDAEARRVLEEALAAARGIDRIGFSVTRFVLRTAGDPAGLELPLFAEVRMRDVEEGELGVQFLARGSYYSEIGPDRERSFVAACDGRTAELLNAGAERPEHRTGDVREFLGPLMALVPAELVDGAPLAAALEAPELRFEGLALVSGVPCDAVRVRAADGTVTRYLVASTDRVVRRIERERAGALEVLTITGLTLRPRWGDEAFLMPGSSGAPAGTSARPAPPPRDDGRAEPELLPTGSPAPAFELVDDAGRTVRLADLAGEVVLLDFWAPWCAPCLAALPGIQRLHEEFEERGLRVLAVTVLPREGQPDPVQFLRERGGTYAVVPRGDGLREAYRVESIPAVYLVDAGGRVLWTGSGHDPSGGRERVLRAVIDAALP